MVDWSRFGKVLQVAEYQASRGPANLYASAGVAVVSRGMGTLATGIGRVIWALTDAYMDRTHQGNGLYTGTNYMSLIK